MKTYRVKLSEDLSSIYEDIAKVNHKSTEECLSIILERVLRTMLHQPGTKENRSEQDIL